MFASMARSMMSRLHGPVYRARRKALVDAIIPHLRPAERVLDVGCGNGTLGAAIMSDPRCPRGLVVEGLERFARGGEPIPVHAYDGVHAPFPDRSYDVVIIADVLHHEDHPHRLLSECVRLSRRLVIIKDHQLAGPLAHARVSFIDWAANAPYGIKCLYRYHTPQEWDRVVADAHLTPVTQLRSMDLYPPGVNLLFGKRLHYLGVLAVPSPSPAPTVPAAPPAAVKA